MIKTEGEHMKKTKKLIIAFLVLLAILSGCGKKEEETTLPENTEETAAAEVQEETKQEEKTEEDVTIALDPQIYPNTDQSDYLNVLLYATNNTDKIMAVTLSYQAFDSEGKVIAAYDQFSDRSKEKKQDRSLYTRKRKGLPDGIHPADGLSVQYQGRYLHA